MIRRVTEEFVHGAVSFVPGHGFLQPCRLAINKRHWLPDPECETLWDKAFRRAGETWQRYRAVPSGPAPIL